MALLREYIQAYKAEHPCVDCGIANPVVLEFDHVRGSKLYTIANMPTKKCSLDTVIAEIAKCDIRCANCHRLVTHERRMRKSNCGVEQPGSSAAS